MTSLARSVLRLEPECQDRLDEMADAASVVLECPVSRAAVVRAAVKEWLLLNEEADPRQFVESIRREMVPRGRKSRKDAPRTRMMPEGEAVAPRDGVGKR